jgi:proline racemase
MQGEAEYGFVVMEQNKIYPAMSGHNCICVVTGSANKQTNKHNEVADR